MTTDKTTPAVDKINTILSKLSIGDAIDIWRTIGDNLHQRISDSKKELDDHESKLTKKEN